MKPSWIVNWFKFNYWVVQVINKYINMVFINKSFPVTYGVVGSKNLFSASLIA